MIEDYYTIRGNLAAIGTSDTEITSIGGAQSFSSADEAYEVVSSAAADAGGGTGLRTIKVEGILETGEQVESTVALNGITPVPLGTFFRVIAVTPLAFGSVGSAVGNVDVRRTTGSAIQKRIPIGGSIDKNANFTVPINTARGTQVTSNNLKINAGKLSASAACVISIKEKKKGKTTFTVVKEYNVPVGTIDVRPLVAIERGSDVVITARAATGTVNVDVELYCSYRKG